MEAGQLYDGESKINDADMRSFQNYMVQAREILHHKRQCPERSIAQSGNCPQMILLQKNDVKSETLYSMPSTNQVSLDIFVVLVLLLLWTLICIFSNLLELG